MLQPTFGMDQACIDTTMSDQECQMPKKIDDVVHVVTGHHAILEDVPLNWAISYLRGGVKALTD